MIKKGFLLYLGKIHLYWPLLLITSWVFWFSVFFSFSSPKASSHLVHNVVIIYTFLEHTIKQEEVTRQLRFNQGGKPVRRY